MVKLEEELSLIDQDIHLMDVEAKSVVDPPPKISPFAVTTNSGNPLVSQYSQIRNSVPPQIQTSQISPQPKSTPVIGHYGKEESYNLHKKNEVLLPEATQCPQPPKASLSKPPQQTPIMVQQVVQSPLYVNLAHGSLQQLPDGRGIVQLDGVQKVNQTTKSPTNQPILLPNNAKGVTPVIIKSDANFSPVLLQSNIINPETQTLMYTSASIQGKILSINLIDVNNFDQ